MNDIFNLKYDLNLYTILIWSDNISVAVAKMDIKSHLYILTILK